jgi:transposase-like protein
MRRRSVKKLCDMTYSERVEMVRQVIVDGQAAKEVAQAYGLKPMCLYQLIRRTKRNRKYMVALLDKEEKNIRARQIIKDTVNEMIE